MTQSSNAAKAQVKSNMPSIQGINQVNKNITELGKRGRNLQSFVHELAFQAMLHASEHSDYSLPAKILNAAPQGVVLKDLRQWFEAFMPVKFNKNKELGLLQSKKNQKSELGDEIKLEEAYATPYFEFTTERRESEQPVFNQKYIMQRLNSTVDKLTKKADESENLADSEKREVLNTLAQVKNALNSITEQSIDF